MKPAHPARRTVCAALGLACAAALPFVAAGRVLAVAPAPQPGADPLDSSRWDDMRRAFFADAPVVFDDRIAVTAPFSAEDPLNVPVAIDATALGAVREVLVFADFNPIVKALRVEPLAAPAAFGLRLKLQQSSPVRAAARTADGTWHLGGAWVRTSGGGCTLPSLGSGSAEWQQRLNEVGARLWPGVGHGDRLRLRIVHPMDTGLAPGIPAFHIETLEIVDGAGRVLVRAEAFEPVSENPVFSFDLPAGIGAAGPLRIRGRDNNGNLIDAEVRP